MRSTRQKQSFKRSSILEDFKAYQESCIALCDIDDDTHPEWERLHSLSGKLANATPETLPEAVALLIFDAEGIYGGRPLASGGEGAALLSAMPVLVEHTGVSLLPYYQKKFKIQNNARKQAVGGNHG